MGGFLGWFILGLGMYYSWICCSCPSCSLPPGSCLFSSSKESPYIRVFSLLVILFLRWALCFGLISTVCGKHIDLLCRLAVWLYVSVLEGLAVGRGVFVGGVVVVASFEVDFSWTLLVVSSLSFSYVLFLFLAIFFWTLFHPPHLNSSVWLKNLFSLITLEHLTNIASDPKYQPSNLKN